MTISTQARAPGTEVCMARKRKWSEDMQARFRAGTFARIAALLEETEDRTDFVREAVEREMTRREALQAERKTKKRKPTGPRN